MKPKLAHPRWLEWLVAFLNGQYWTRCPICGQMFGAHERADEPLMKTLYNGVHVCVECGDEAKRRNEEFFSKPRNRMVWH